MDIPWRRRGHSAETDRRRRRYGDGASRAVLAAAGVSAPRAVVVAYSSATRRAETVARLRGEFPETPIYARAGGGPSGREAQDLEAAGATALVQEATEMGLGLAALVADDEGSAFDREAAAGAIFQADARRPRAAAGAPSGSSAAPGVGWRALGRSLRRRARVTAGRVMRRDRDESGGN